MKHLPQLLKKIAKRKILVIGDIMLDHYFWGDSNRISPEAPVPVVNVFNATDTVGGAANVANNIAALGAQVEVIGAVGRDYNGDKLRANLKDHGISFDENFVLKEIKTITKTRVLVRNQQLCRLDHEDNPSAYRKLLEDPKRWKRLEAKIKKVDGIILSDYAKGVLSTPLIAQLEKLARKYGKFIALDPKPSSGNLFYNFDVITPNRREAFELAGLGHDEDHVNLDAVCNHIWTKYAPKALVITLGADGMLTSIKGKVKKIIPTAARQVYDVSGAGDTVIAALVLAMTSGATLDEATHFANAAAGVVVGKLGTATVSPEELTAYVNG
ncbi:MAG: bifunctional ADP-heptose synthase [Verrucomicrobiota bacterium]|jgi:D-beta-D-heptose 7-phosphate kinase/D-beta-D-heptose 1-phosphate adenosyltransferase